MDEKTAMTIGFLRARLLSERTVSRTARQRTELLTRRVMELEEQLRIVNIQRKKAEKMTEEIVTILGTQGITCICRLSDSGSEQGDIHCKLSEDIRGDEGFTTSRMSGSEIDDASSCSEIDGCSQYKSLSWKSHSTSLDTQEKQNARQLRHGQRNSFIFTVKSSQHCPGKSCRKIKRRDIGEIEAGSGKDYGMERALEQQAQLIGQFEAMENAQKEWEEKFYCSEIPMLGDSEPCARISAAENSNWSEENSKLVEKVHQHKEEGRLCAEYIPFAKEKIAGRCRNGEATDKKVEASDKFLSSDSIPTSPALDTVIQQYDTIAKNDLDIVIQQYDTNAKNDSENVSQVFRCPSAGIVGLSAEETDIQGSANEKHSTLVNTDQKIHLNEQVIRQTTATAHHAPIKGEKISSWKNPEIKNLPKRLYQPKSSSVGSVIESLQRAQISLRKEIIKRPSLSQGTLTTSAPVHSPNASIGHSGLFRLPTDSFPHAQLPRPNIYGSGLRLTATQPDLGLASAGKGYFDQSLSVSHLDAGYRVFPWKDYADQSPAISHMDVKQYVNRYPTRFLETGSQVSMAKDYNRSSGLSLTSPSPSEYQLPYSSLPMKNMPLHN